MDRRNRRGPAFAALGLLLLGSSCGGGGSSSDNTPAPLSGDQATSGLTPNKPQGTNVAGTSSPGGGTAPAGSPGASATGGAQASTTASGGATQPPQGGTTVASGTPLPTATPLPSSPATVALSSATGDKNDTVEITITATGGPIGGLAMDISFDPAVVEILECVVTDRAVCNPHFDENTARMAMADERGAEGKLGTITFRLVGNGGTSSELTPSIITCTTADVRPLDCAVTSGSVTVSQ